MASASPRDFKGSPTFRGMILYHVWSSGEVLPYVYSIPTRPVNPVRELKKSGRRLALLAAFAASACDGGSGGGPVGTESATLVVAPTWQEPVALPAAGAPLSLTCALQRADGGREEVPAAQVTSLHGSMGGTCASVIVRRSAVDTLEITTRGLRMLLPVAVALPPEVPSGPLPTALFMDSILGGVPWAPTLRRADDGTVELYLGVIAGWKESLVRLRAGGDNVFHVETTVFTPPVDDCDRFGTGFEHVAIVPRAEASGWRMLFVGGGPCHGWTVYSAVSPDARAWAVEQGKRVGNGAELLWSQGEGIEVDRLPNGDWRMLTGGIVPATPPVANVYEILEWRSHDQLTWSYVGKALSKDDMPEGANGSVYSPTIREFAPGLFRMIFTADNRDGPGPNRSALWSAVSTDRTHWQVERELLGAPGANLYYATLVDELLVSIQGDPQVFTTNRVVRATVRMP